MSNEHSNKTKEVKGYYSDGSLCDTDDKKCVARQLSPNHFQLRTNRITGEPFNPVDNPESELGMFIRGIGVEKYPFVGVNKQCFSYYLNFLKSKNRAEFAQVIRMCSIQ